VYGKVGYPYKDVGVEADMVLRDVEATLDENLALKGTSIIW
jgi:hypothetical protein